MPDGLLSLGFFINIIFIRAFFIITTFIAFQQSRLLPLEDPFLIRYSSKWGKTYFSAECLKMEEKVILAVACLTVRCQLRLCFIVRLPAMTFLAHMTFYRMTKCLITFSLKNGCPWAAVVAKRLRISFYRCNHFTI